MKLLRASWQAPDNVHAVTTTRLGGVSMAPFDSLNVGQHVGDDPAHVSENRHRVAQALSLPNAPIWLEQVHGTHVLTLEAEPSENNEADAVYTQTAGQICTIMTADCLPVVFFSSRGNEVAAAHAGWRGLCNGVLESTLSHFTASPEEISVWLGPAIGPAKFEVGTDVREAFLRHDNRADAAFKSQSAGKFLANIYLLARQRLHAAGIASHHIFGGEYCTVTDSQNFFSYRRDGQTGRMATLIWFD